MHTLTQMEVKKNNVTNLPIRILAHSFLKYYKHAYI